MKKTFFKSVPCALLFMFGFTVLQASAQETIAEWTFNYDYDIVGGVGTPNSTVINSNSSVNLESVKLKPNSQAVESAEFYVTTIRHENTTENPMQSSNGAYLEYASISADGAALHMTSPLPNPETDATSFTWGESSYDYSPAGTYSYSNPYNYFEFELNTADYSSLTLTVKAAGHKCEADGQKVVAMVSVDKSSWTQLSEIANLVSGYNKWTTTTFVLPASLNRQEKCYVRLMPAATWKSSSSGRNKDNQLNLDNVKLEGTFSSTKALVESVSISGVTITEGSTTDWACKLSKSYTAETLTFSVVSSNAVLTVTAENEETGASVSVTDNGDGTYTMPTPAGNTATVVTIGVTGQDEAVVIKSSYTFRIFHMEDILITELLIDGKAVDVLDDINGSSSSATLSGNIYTAVPSLSATFIDGGTASATGISTGTTATYSFSYEMEGTTRTFSLTVEGIHIYNTTESDKVVEFRYSSENRASDGNSWSKDGYTFHCNNIDGWSGTQFKINSTDVTWEIPANVKVKQMIMKSFFSNYEPAEGAKVVSVTSEGATVYLPTNSEYQQGSGTAYDLVVNFENHAFGEPIAIKLQGGSQPVAWFEFVIDEMPVSVTTTAVGWASACLAYDAEVPAGTKAYYVSDISGSSLVLMPIETIPAGEGFIFNAIEGTHNFAVAETAPAPIENKLIGTLYPLNVTPSSIYVLGKRSDDNVGFLLYTGTTLDGGKAYLPAPEDGAKISYSFSFYDVTGITTVKTAALTDAPVYNLNGQRVEKPAKGLYIQNGHKVIVK
ncbi:MAG: hypothetical protein ACI4TW_04925 [Prevotella sp.]